MAHKSYDNEFKEMIVGLLESGMSRKAVGDEYGLNYGMIGRWKREFWERKGNFADIHAPSAGETQLRALQKALREVKLERDILKKAVGIFSKSDR